MRSQPSHAPSILLVDDHCAVREALGELLVAHGLTVLAQSSNREEALALVATQRPDLALVDLSPGRADGLALVAELNLLDIPVVVLSSHEEFGYVRQALDMGARAYVSKRDARHVLIRTLQDVLDGWVLVSPSAATELPPDRQGG